MKTSPVIEWTIYAAAVVLSLAALWLVLNVPPDFLNSHVVYQGF